MLEESVQKYQQRIWCFFAKVVTIISANGSRNGSSEEDKDRFYDELRAEIQLKHGNCMALRYFNGHVGSLINGYERVLGGHGSKIRNKNGKRLLEFADSFDMVVDNTFFKKKIQKS